VRATLTLIERELVRFLRQPNRVAGAIGQPLIFWLLFGAAFKSSFSAPGGQGGSYARFFLPGIAVLIVLFTAIFSTISIIEDRREGFLQGVLVAPVARGWMVLGKILGGTILAVLQAALFLLLAPIVGIGLSPLSFLGAVGVLGLVGFSLTGLGFSIAWRMDSTQGFHAIMSVFLVPMWLLSGSFFPTEGLDPWLAWILRLNPLTYGVSALRHAIDMGGAGPSAGVSLGVTALFAACMLGLSMRLARRPAAGDLR
jgi:ABC-2 type transport system permease protein